MPQRTTDKLKKKNDGKIEHNISSKITSKIEFRKILNGIRANENSIKFFLEISILKLEKKKQNGSENEGPEIE